MIKSIHIFLVLLSLTLVSCSPRFDRVKADDILQKSELTESDYSELIELYEIGIDDVLELAKKDNADMTENDREEIITMFAIGKRLMLDEDKLTDSQAKEFDRITKKGTEGLNNDINK